MDIREVQKQLGTGPLLIRLNEDLGRLKAGSVVQLPYEAAIRAIYRRYAVVPTGNFRSVFADICIESEEQMEQAALHMLIGDAEASEIHHV